MIAEIGRSNMAPHMIEELIKVWPTIRHIFKVPHTDEEYNEMVQLLDELTDHVGNDESHPLASLMETLGSLVEAYETQNLPDMQGSPLQVLQDLMAMHELKQSDLSDVGTQGVVSEVLTGKRKLNLRQIKALSKRFHVSPAVFVA
jgi:HTH-type transcriptional regulator/antitoxin HigA